MIYPRPFDNKSHLSSCVFLFITSVFGIISNTPVVLTRFLLGFIIKFPYNAHSDWLKQCALSENKARVDDGKLAFKFVIRNFDKFDPN